MMLTGPVAGFSRYTNPSVAATGGANAGQVEHVRKKPAPVRARASISPTPNANTTRSGTATGDDPERVEDGRHDVRVGEQLLVIGEPDSNTLNQ